MPHRRIELFGGQTTRPAATVVLQRAVVESGRNSGVQRLHRHTNLGYSLTLMVQVRLSSIGVNPRLMGG
jgi:hypothetical protein